MTAIEIPRPLRRGGWLARLARALRRVFSRRPRRLDPRSLSDHMRRDIGLIDSAPVKKLS